MRALVIQVPHGRGVDVLRIAEAHHAVNASLVAAQAPEGPIDLLSVHVSNQALEGFLDDIQTIADVRITLVPRGILTLHPPADQASQQAVSVEERSPIEIFLSGLQSVGSWRGYLGYAAAAGVVVWVGLFTETIYLLTAAMLIAPFAGPAMNLGIATARGDRELILRSTGRYAVGIAATMTIAAVLTALVGLEIPTNLMIDVANLSAVAVALPLAAGAAGALNLVQSDRASLVSGAAVGMLVAASLAPPAGVAAIAAVLGRWDLAISGIFVLLLQLAGINITAAIVFRLYGLTTRGVRYTRGRRWAAISTFSVSVAALAALLAWQFSGKPMLLQSSEAKRAAATVHRLIDDSGIAILVAADVRFVRAQASPPHALLVSVQVRRTGNDLGEAVIRERLSRALIHRLRDEIAAMPLVDVAVLYGP